MPSKEGKRALYIAGSMAELQKKSDVKTPTSNARILVKSADTMFREAEKFDGQGDEERAFIMYMRYFNIIKQVKMSADYKKNKKYFDDLIGQKNQVRAIEQAEQLSESLKERYEFKEAEAVAKKFAALEAAGKRHEKDGDEDLDQKPDSKVNGTNVDGKPLQDGPSTSTEKQVVQPLITPTALCDLLRDGNAQLIVMDARSGANFAESHINHAATISVPQEILPAGTTVNRIESQLPQESQLLWRQRGHVDHIVVLDWNSTLESLTIGTTLRTLKDALFKYDSTVIIKSEPLVLEGGYDQWLLYYPTMTTNARVSRPVVSTSTRSLTSLDFDYPDFEEPQTEKPPAPDLSDFADQSTSLDNITTMSGSIPSFNRALKPKTPGASLANSIAKTSDLNNVRNVNLARDSPSGQGLNILSNKLYPSVVMTKKPEKNTNIVVDKRRAVEDSSQVDKNTILDAPSVVSPSQQEIEQKARLHDLEEKRKKEEKALADIMRKKRHMEQDLKDTERLAQQEKEARESRDQAVQEEEAERRRQAEVERLRLARKKKEQEAHREKERLDNLAKERELQEAQEQARKEEEERQAERKAAEQHAEKLRQERAEKARQEAEKQAEQKRDEELRAAALHQEEEEERKRKEEEQRKMEEEKRKERLEREKAETALKEEEARKTKQAEEEKRAKEEKEKAETADHTTIRHAQEPKMIPSPSLPTGWEKRLDSSTRRYYYIDHNQGKTQWEPPSMPKQPKQKDTYTTRLKEEPATSGRGLSRSHSSPDIMKQLADEARASSKPVFDRNIKPSIRTPEVTPTRTPMMRQVARRRDLNPVFGNVGSALTGLRNLGNTCYMNSTIQCLNNTTPLVSYFLNDLFLKDINRDSVQGMHGEVVDEFAVVVKALWSGQYRCITPRDLKGTVGKYNPMFAGYQQQDSQEFLTFLLDGLHEGLNEVKVRPQIPDQENDKIPDGKAAHLAWENHKRLHRSIIVELFQGQLKSTLMCRTCHKKSVTFQAFMYISLPIPASNRCTLRDCFRAFLQPEMMTGSCKWKCPQCRMERDAEKKIDIWKMPHILLIGLNRFVSDGMWMQKKTTYVDFPVNELDLEEFTLGPKQRSRYNLYGVSNHYGTMEGGHYTAFCRNPCNSKWHKFDDHEVYEMSKSDVKTSAAFVLYYTAIPLNAPQFKPQL